MFHVGDGYGKVMNSDPAFTLGCRVEQRTLDVYVRVVATSEAIRVLIKEIVLLNLVKQHAVAVDGRAKDEICCFVLDLDVSVCLSLVKAGRCPDPEHAFPCCLPN